MLQPDRILYEAEVTATGGRDGKAASDDGLLSVSGGPGD
jgi:organic hydroperoxide reductase OsmC/OhrA